jgi:hypothetical protein
MATPYSAAIPHTHRCFARAEYLAILTHGDSVRFLKHVQQELIEPQTISLTLPSWDRPTLPTRVYPAAEIGIESGTNSIDEKKDL